MEHKIAISIIGCHEWSLLLVRPDGSISDVIGMDSIPTLEHLKEATAKYPDSGCRCVSRSNLNEDQLLALIDDTLKVMQWGERHDLKPGANLINKEQL